MSLGCLYFILRAEETGKENMIPSLMGLPISWETY